MNRYPTSPASPVGAPQPGPASTSSQGQGLTHSAMDSRYSSASSRSSYGLEPTTPTRPNINASGGSSGGRGVGYSGGRYTLNATTPTRASSRSQPHPHSHSHSQPARSSPSSPQRLQLHVPHSTNTSGQPLYQPSFTLRPTHTRPGFTSFSALNPPPNLPLPASPQWADPRLSAHANANYSSSSSVNSSPTKLRGPAPPSIPAAQPPFTSYSTASTASTSNASISSSIQARFRVASEPPSLSPPLEQESEHELGYEYESKNERQGNQHEHGQEDQHLDEEEDKLRHMYEDAITRSDDEVDLLASTPTRKTSGPSPAPAPTLGRKSSNGSIATTSTSRRIRPTKSSELLRRLSRVGIGACASDTISGGRYQPLSDDEEGGSELTESVISHANSHSNTHSNTHSDSGVSQSAVSLAPPIPPPSLRTTGRARSGTVSTSTFSSGSHERSQGQGGGPQEASASGYAPSMLSAPGSKSLSDRSGDDRISHSFPMPPTQLPPRAPTSLSDPFRRMSAFGPGPGQSSRMSRSASTPLSFSAAAPPAAQRNSSGIDTGRYPSFPSAESVSASVQGHTKRPSDPATGRHSQNEALIAAETGGMIAFTSTDGGIDNDEELRSRAWSESTPSEHPSRRGTRHSRSYSDGVALLARQGTLFHPSGSTQRASDELGIMLGGPRSRRLSATRLLPAPELFAWGAAAPGSTGGGGGAGTTPDKIRLEASKKGKARVEVDVILERECVIEGGEIRGRLEIIVRGGKRGEGLRVGGGKVRVLGFEDVSASSRHIFYQQQQELPLFSYPPAIDGPSSSLFGSSPDDEGFRLAVEGTHSVPFRVRLPLGAGAKGSYTSPGGKGPCVRYVVVGSVKLHIPSSGKRAIAHFYRPIVLLPYLNPALVLAPVPSPIAARTENGLGWSIKGEKGKVSVQVALGRRVWVSGQRLWCEVGVKNDSSKKINKIALALLQTVQTFDESGIASSRTKLKPKPKATLNCTGGGANDFEVTPYAPEGEAEAEAATTQRRKVSEEVVEADFTEHGAGRVTGKGWWTGLEPGERDQWDMSVQVPTGMISIPRSKLIQVSYTLRVTVNGTIYVDVPVELVNFLSIDPPPMPGDAPRNVVLVPGVGAYKAGVVRPPTTVTTRMPALSQEQQQHVGLPVVGALDVNYNLRPLVDRQDSEMSMGSSRVVAARASSTTLHLDALIQQGRDRARATASASPSSRTSQEVLRSRPLSIGSAYSLDNKKNGGLGETGTSSPRSTLSRSHTTPNLRPPTSHRGHSYRSDGATNIDDDDGDDDDGEGSGMYTPGIYAPDGAPREISYNLIEATPTRTPEETTPASTSPRVPVVHTLSQVIEDDEEEQANAAMLDELVPAAADDATGYAESEGYGEFHYDDAEEEDAEEEMRDDDGDKTSESVEDGVVPRRDVDVDVDAARRGSVVRDGRIVSIAVSAISGVSELESELGQVYEATKNDVSVRHPPTLHEFNDPGDHHHLAVPSSASFPSSLNTHTQSNNNSTPPPPFRRVSNGQSPHQVSPAVRDSSASGGSGPLSASISGSASGSASGSPLRRGSAPPASHHQQQLVHAHGSSNLRQTAMEALGIRSSFSFASRDARVGSGSKVSFSPGPSPRTVSHDKAMLPAAMAVDMGRSQSAIDMGRSHSSVSAHSHLRHQVDVTTLSPSMESDVSGASGDVDGGGGVSDEGDRVPALAPSVASDSASSDVHELESPPAPPMPSHFTMPPAPPISARLSGSVVVPERFTPRPSRDVAADDAEFDSRAPSPVSTAHESVTSMLPAVRSRIAQLESRDEALRKFSVASSTGISIHAAAAAPDPSPPTPPSKRRSYTAALAPRSLRSSSDDQIDRIGHTTHVARRLYADNASPASPTSSYRQHSNNTSWADKNSSDNIMSWTDSPEVTSPTQLSRSASKALQRAFSNSSTSTTATEVERALTGSIGRATPASPRGPRAVGSAKPRQQPPSQPQPQTQSQSPSSKQSLSPTKQVQQQQAQTSPAMARQLSPPTKQFSYSPSGYSPTTTKQMTMPTPYSYQATPHSYQAAAARRDFESMSYDEEIEESGKSYNNSSAAAWRGGPFRLPPLTFARGSATEDSEESEGLL